MTSFSLEGGVKAIIYLQKLIKLSITKGVVNLPTEELARVFYLYSVIILFFCYVYLYCDLFYIY